MTTWGFSHLCLPSCHRNSGIADMCFFSWHFVDSRDSFSVLHTSAVSIFTTESTFQPSNALSKIRAINIVLETSWWGKGSFQLKTLRSPHCSGLSVQHPIGKNQSKSIEGVLLTYWLVFLWLIQPAFWIRAPGSAAVWPTPVIAALPYQSKKYTTDLSIDQFGGGGPFSIKVPSSKMTSWCQVDIKPATNIFYTFFPTPEILFYFIFLEKSSFAHFVGPIFQPSSEPFFVNMGPCAFEYLFIVCMCACASPWMPMYLCTPGTHVEAEYSLQKSVLFFHCNSQELNWDCHGWWQMLLFAELFH